MKRFLSCAIIAFCVFPSMNVWAGVLSHYRIVGISDNSRYLAFGEYGIGGDNKFFTEVYIVDIEQNSFVSDGIFRKTYDVKPHVGQSGLHAFIDSIVFRRDALRYYGINFINTGRLIYVLLNGREADDELSFIDHERATSYDVYLKQHARLNAEQRPEAAFTLDVSIRGEGTRVSTTVGTARFYRSAVERYLIRAVYTTPRNDALIFVIEKKMRTAHKESPNLRYMVETVKWR